MDEKKAKPVPGLTKLARTFSPPGTDVAVFVEESEPGKVLFWLRVGQEVKSLGDSYSQILEQFPCLMA